MEESVTRIRIAYALRKRGIPVEEIAVEVGKSRATLFRWFKGIRQRGIEGFIRQYRKAKKGRRVGKTHSYVEQRVLSVRREYRGCCGQKIVYLLGREGIRLSVSTVYRVLNKQVELRKHTRTAKGQPIHRASQPREVIQMDTVDFDGLFAFTAIDIFTKEAQVVMRPSLTAEDGQAALQQVMSFFGHCQTIQTDGGSEFEKEFAQTLPKFADQHIIARPYRKNDQAFIECFNGSLRREEFGHTPFKAVDLSLAQHRADNYLTFYHTRRPHLSLHMLTPSAFAESHLP